VDCHLAPGAGQAAGESRDGRGRVLYGSLSENPRRVGQPLRLGLEGLHSARRGDYRVIYRIDDHARQVIVMAIEHRSDVYRPRS
jgi:mRNA-degrading endonuclease RelE of RelBE toxin-antitoxin system